MTRRQFLLLILPLFVVLLGFLVLGIAERRGVGAPTRWDDGFATAVRETLAREYVGGVRDERLAWEAYFNAMDAYVRTFDEHAEVTPPWKLEEERQFTSGQYGGIGVLTNALPAAGGEGAPSAEGPLDAVRVTGMKPDGPAARAGLLLGEEIVAVDGRSIAALLASREPGALERAIRGPEGTEVRLTVRARSGASRDLSIRREAISSGSVFGARFVDEAQKIAYLRIQNFHLETARDFRLRLKEFQGKGMRALILDLRSNSGGLLEQALEVANALLPRGTLVRMRGRSSAFSDVREARPDAAVAPDVPLAVLVDRLSASASEVLAGALQDHRRGVLVGEPTWGKFKVQTVRNVATDAGTAVLKITTSLYETPSGKIYQRDASASDPLAGLRPDIFLYVPDAERTTVLESFAEDLHSDWLLEPRPPREPPPDRVVEAALALFRGESYYPELPGGS